MKLHADARLSVKGRELLVDRVEVAGWSVTICAAIGRHRATSAHIPIVSIRGLSPGNTGIPRPCRDAHLYLQAGGRRFDPAWLHWRTARKRVLCGGDLAVAEAERLRVGEEVHQRAPSGSVAARR